MKERKKRLGIISGILMFLFIINILGQPINPVVTAFKSNRDNSEIKFLGLTDHEAIRITNDGNFSDYGFPGVGDMWDPYVIENYKIITSENDGIYIYGTTEYFLIRNCYIEAIQYGIQINSVISGTASLVNNTCTNSQTGIYITWSVQSSIINNTCSENSQFGIYVTSSSATTIFNNTCQSNGVDGLLVGYSDLYTIANNTILDDGIVIQPGIFSNYYSYTIENNTVNGKEFVYLINENEKIYDGSTYGQVYLVDCSNSTISNLDISYTGDSVRLIHCENVTIKNSIFKNNKYAIYSFESFGNIKIANNIFESNNAGLYIQEIFNIKITNNFFESNLNAIYISDAYNSLLTDNTFYRNEWGFSYSYSNTSLVTKNLFQETDNFAVIMGSESYDSVIYHNTFENNNLGFQQARDEGENNLWYNDTLQEGNYWSDWSGTGSYSIYGSALSEDLYPLANPIIPTILEFSQIEISLILMLLPTIFVIVLLGKKKKRR